MISRYMLPRADLGLEPVHIREWTSRDYFSHGLNAFYNNQRARTGLEKRYHLNLTRRARYNVDICADITYSPPA